MPAGVKFLSSKLFSYPALVSNKIDISRLVYRHIRTYNEKKKKERHTVPKAVEYIVKLRTSTHPLFAMAGISITSFLHTGQVLLSLNHPKIHFS